MKHLLINELSTNDLLDLLAQDYTMRDTESSKSINMRLFVNLQKGLIFLLRLQQHFRF